ncbi:2847_t:CDS:2 [Funneliformis mosseae]|uniref:2847_t:CDS:1 n=1 Tax=Funneliformis mosseae TaxID=27381 RepID=A0A9N9DW21_FUNMO|nr:2847_t:CDS:2 [Funneliformis mosseae]
MTIEEVSQVLQKENKELDEIKAILKAFKEGKSKGKLLIELKRKLLNKDTKMKKRRKNGKRDYFIDKNVSETGNTVFSLCEATIMLTIIGSENNLINEYDALIK